VNIVIGSTTVPATVASDTSLSFVFPSTLVAGSYNVAVRITNLGDAGFFTANNLF
jgi:hypothetical protein